eukprot:superscaffoldBa00000376_g4223
MTAGKWVRVGRLGEDNVLRWSGWFRIDEEYGGLDADRGEGSRGRLPGDEWELKVGPGRVRWDDGVEERDEAGRWRWDDRGPNGITKRLERLGTRGSRLRVGDQILEVNGQSFVTISHDEAVHILKTGHHLLMKVRDVGRLPHARTVVDETKWISSQAIAETNATVNPSSVTNPAVNAGILPSISASACNSSVGEVLEPSMTMDLFSCGSLVVRSCAPGTVMA